MKNEKTKLKESSSICTFRSWCYFTMSAMNISSVSAASTGSITVHTGKHDVNGVNFNAYRLMDATVSGNKVSYSISSNFTGFFTEELLNWDNWWWYRYQSL